MEVWKKIEGYEGHYSISSEGNVKRNKCVIIARNGVKNPLKEKIKSLQISNKGYKQVMLWKNNKCKLVLVHRLVAMHFVDNPRGVNVVNHIDGVPLNCNYKNLEWCTQKENVRHAIKNGFWRHADNCNFSKLTETKVLEILKDGRIKSKIAKEYDVSYETINRIKKGVTWKHVYAKYIKEKMVNNV